MHNGHLALAEACRSQAGLDEVWFVPTAVQPHKPSGPVASDEHRVAMLNRAIAGRPGLVCSLVEVERGGVSYTADTLRTLRDAFPSNRFALLMGADTLADLPNWREPDQLLALAAPLVVCRPGYRLDADLLPPMVKQSGYKVIEMPPQEISSSAIRHAIARGGDALGGDLADAFPKSVGEYIAQHRLYRDTSA